MAEVLRFALTESHQHSGGVHLKGKRGFSRMASHTAGFMVTYCILWRFEACGCFSYYSGSNGFS